MKKTTKFGLLLTAAAAAIAMTFMGCDVLDTFGKDDFYGHWKTTDFDESGNRVEYYQNGSSYYQIEWEFDGTSENLFNADGGTFRQHLTRYSDAALTSKVNETFWTGAYKLTSNSGYDKGKLYLYYEFGAQLMDYDKYTAVKNDGAAVSYSDVYGWTNEDFLNVWKYGKKDVSAEEGDKGYDLLADNSLYTSNAMSDACVIRNGVLLQVRYADQEKKKDPVCSDIEYFRFRLEDGTVSGYGRMMTTTMNKNGSAEIGLTYNKWLSKAYWDESKAYQELGNYSNTYGCPVKSGCSWSGMNFRCLARLKRSSDYTEYSSNDPSTNAQLFKITVNPSTGKISSIDDSEDDDSNDYSVIEQ